MPEGHRIKTKNRLGRVVPAADAGLPVEPARRIGRLDPGHLARWIGGLQGLMNDDIATELNEIVQRRLIAKQGAGG